MGKFIDLTGKKYGKLTVTRRAENKISPNGYTYTRWYCDCDCGTKNIIMMASNLKTGGTSSCGCSKNVVENLVGKKFNKLTVINQADSYIDSFGNKFTQWNCICDCKVDNPNYVIVRGAYLKNGNTKSCGCFKKEQHTKTHKKYNKYDLTGDYGTGYTFKDEPFYFDLEDYDKIKNHCWRYDKYGYVITTIESGSNMYFHRLVMSPSKDEGIDHIYHIVWDNRKSQLRIVTQGQNMMNRTISKDNTTGVKGVKYTGKNKPWTAGISINYKFIQKSFYKKEDAIEYRKMLEKKYHGEYAFKANKQLNNALKEVSLY